MKNYKLFVIGLCLLLFSCRKKEIYPTEQLPSNVPSINETKSINSWGKFLIIDAVMYVQNNETNEKFVFNHFGPNKDTSSLRWGGSLFEIENIVKNKTTYSFWSPSSYPGIGLFVLNGDTSKHYVVQYNGPSRSIIENPFYNEQLIGGSARPFSGQTIDYDNKIIAIQIEEVEASINGSNCKYWTQLTLKKIEEW